MAPESPLRYKTLPELAPVMRGETFGSNLFFYICNIRLDMT